MIAKTVVECRVEEEFHSEEQNRNGNSSFFEFKKQKQINSLMTRQSESAICRIENDATSKLRQSNPLWAAGAAVEYDCRPQSKLTEKLFIRLISARLCTDLRLMSMLTMFLAVTIANKNKKIWDPMQSRTKNYSIFFIFHPQCELVSVDNRT